MRGARFLSPSSAPLLGRAATFSGNAIYHTTSDRLDAVRQMDNDFTTLYRELAAECGADDVFWAPADAPLALAAKLNHQKFPERLAWWLSNAKPIFDSWVSFKSEQTGGGRTGASNYIALGERFLTDWPVYESWHDVLDTLRQAAEIHLKKPLQTPKPRRLPTTITQDVVRVVDNAATAITDKAGEVWTLGKVAIYGGLSLLGVVAIGSLVANVRAKKDPATPYMKLWDKARPAITSRKRES